MTEPMPERMTNLRHLITVAVMAGEVIARDRESNVARDFVVKKTCIWAKAVGFKVNSPIHREGGPTKPIEIQKPTPQAVSTQLELF